MFALLLIQHVLTRGSMMVLAASFFVWAWTMEIGRRHSPTINRLLMRFFGPIAHAHEAERINSATWYVSALLALSLTASTMSCSLAVIVLGIGDPAAAFIGRRWGRTRLASGRSLEGSLGFLVCAGAAALVTLRVYYPAFGFGAAVAIALAASLAGALAELLTAGLDDNLVIPLAAAAGASAVAAALG